MGKLQTILFTLFVIFTLYVANSFIHSLILLTLIALTLDNILPSNLKESPNRHIYVFFLGLVGCILYIFRLLSIIALAFGFLIVFHLPLFLIWLLGNMILLAIFGNLILFPFVTYMSRFLGKNIREALLISIIFLSIISIIWQANYRTIAPEYELISFHDSMTSLINDRICRDYRIFALKQFMTVIRPCKMITIKHAILQYTIADIYLSTIVSVWYSDNYTLVSIGTGLFLMNYLTETGKRLVKEIESDVNIDIKMNVTPIKSEYTLLECSINFARIGEALIYFHLFETPGDIAIKLNFSSTWSIKRVVLSDLKAIKGPMFSSLIRNVTLEIYHHENYVKWVEEIWKPNYEETTSPIKVIGVLHTVFMDPLTFLEFYKYEIMLTIVLAITLPWTKILAGKSLKKQK